MNKPIWKRFTYIIPATIHNRVVFRYQIRSAIVMEFVKQIIQSLTHLRTQEKSDAKNTGMKTYGVQRKSKESSKQLSFD